MFINVNIYRSEKLTKIAPILWRLWQKKKLHTMHYTFPSIKEKQEKLALTLHQKIEFLNIFFPMSTIIL